MSFAWQYMSRSSQGTIVLLTGALPTPSPSILLIDLETPISLKQCSLNHIRDPTII